MPCRGKPITAHTSIIGTLISSLSKRGQTDDDIACFNTRIVNHLATLDTGCYGRIHDDGTHQITYIGCFPTGRVDMYSILGKLCDKLLGTIDNSGNDLPGDELFVAAYGGGKQYIIGNSYTE